MNCSSFTSPARATWKEFVALTPKRICAPIVHPFFAEMHLALGAATVAVSRAGASSLAELAAMRVPSVLIPFPAATDNHQFFNARAFEETGAARLLEQKNATPESLASLVSELMADAPAREKCRRLWRSGTRRTRRSKSRK